MVEIISKMFYKLNRSLSNILNVNKESMCVLDTGKLQWGKLVWNINISQSSQKANSKSAPHEVCGKGTLKIP